ncbi:hypothetical protein SAMN05216360_11967 [Methylobacterium phyllostachyos]|uniref:Uncharacterized protein n=1 Tax=Methylobacterium phyllostachyos TaxID=582672 RepID=A0A1H0ILN4_9HYPH|nr:hypothetical protein [Methylobacterium phyllostachyos]SDO32200.1 hypothetical protein SAMN05216360_11967 [Methylobacterium phyllostachyos]
MDTPAPGTEDSSIPSKETLAAMPVEAFVAAWRTITGEPPAIMLSSHAAMIALLIASTPVAPLQPTIPVWNGDGADASTRR